MPESPWRRVLDVVRRRTDPDATGPLADERLLARFVANGDPSAFELLVWRHGSLVYGTCRRILGDAHAAEDAFQATFLALARKPRAVRSGAALAGWLHRVAVRIAHKLRVSRTRQVAVERRAARSVETNSEPHDAETMCIVDEEIDRLPARLRSVVVLCYLDGRTTEQAAEILGCPRGTVLSRLSTARERLRDRLTRRGFTLPVAGISALTLASESPATLIPAAVRTALTEASPLITGLVQGVFHAMLLTKVKIATAVVLGIGLAGAGVGWVVVPGSGPGVVQAEEQKSGVIDAKPSSPESQKQMDNEALRTFLKILDAKTILAKKIEEAEQAHHDNRMRNPFLGSRVEHSHSRLAMVAAKRTELLLREAEAKSRLAVLRTAMKPMSEKAQLEDASRIALLKLQMRGIDVSALRRAANVDGKELPAAQFLITYAEALESEMEELKAGLKALEDISEYETKVLREVMHFELQDERFRNQINEHRKLLEVVVRRISELNLVKDQEMK